MDPDDSWSPSYAILIPTGRETPVPLPLGAIQKSLTEHLGSHPSGQCGVARPL